MVFHHYYMFRHVCAIFKVLGHQIKKKKLAGIRQIKFSKLIIYNILQLNSKYRVVNI